MWNNWKPHLLFAGEWLNLDFRITKQTCPCVHSTKQQFCSTGYALEKLLHTYTRRCMQECLRMHNSSKLGEKKQTSVCQQQNGCCDSVVHIMAYSTTVKMKEPQLSTSTWLNLKNQTSLGKSKFQRESYRTITFA